MCPRRRFSSSSLAPPSSWSWASVVYDEQIKGKWTRGIRGCGEQRNKRINARAKTSMLGQDLLRTCRAATGAVVLCIKFGQLSRARCRQCGWRLPERDIHLVDRATSALEGEVANITVDEWNGPCVEFEEDGLYLGLW